MSGSASIIELSSVRELNQRNGSVDILRWLGAIGIILFHLKLPGGLVGYAALPFFVALVVYYSANRPLSAIAIRLLGPWLVWSAVYGGLKLGQAWLAGTPFATEFAPWMWFTGPALHLWFLPFSFAAVAAVRFAGPWGTLLLGVPLAVWSLYICNIGSLGIPLLQWAYVAPAAVLGGVMCYWRQSREFSLVAVGLGAAWAWVGLGWGMAAPQLALTCAVLLAAFALPLRPARWISALSDMSLGLYLIHPLVIAVALIFGFAGWELFAVTFVVSHVLVIGLRKTARWAV